MKSLVTKNIGYPETVFFYQGTVEEGSQFFSEFWPEARAVSDPEGRFYDAFKVPMASLRETLGPGVWLKALKAARRGFGTGRPIGDIWRMPGMFLVEDGQILWQWKFRHIGDHPDFSQIPRRASG